MWMLTAMHFKTQAKLRGKSAPHGGFTRSAEASLNAIFDVRRQQGSSGLSLYCTFAILLGFRLDDMRFLVTYKLAARHQLQSAPPLAPRVNSEMPRVQAKPWCSARACAVVWRRSRSPISQGVNGVVHVKTVRESVELFFSGHRELMLTSGTCQECCVRCSCR